MMPRKMCGSNNLYKLHPQKLPLDVGRDKFDSNLFKLLRQLCGLNGLSGIRLSKQECSTRHI